MNFRRTIARATAGLVLGATVLTGLPTIALADTPAELQAKLDQANSHLSGLYDEASRVSEEVNKTQEDLDATNAEIEQKTAELAQAQDTLSRRVASNYKTGGVSLVSILFDSTSFEDMVNRITYASKVSDSDAQIIQQVKDIQSELDQKRAEQQQLLDDLKAQQSELDGKVAEAQSYVSSLDQQVQDALEAERAAAAGEVEDKRLGVIVGIMRRGDKPAAALFRGALQKLIAQPPCRILGPKSVHQSIARHVPVTDDAFYPTLRAPVFHKARVSQRFLAADAVFIVRSDNVRAA